MPYAGTSPMPSILEGRTVLITRRKEQSAELRDALDRLGATVRFFPTIQVVPPQSWAECDAALSELESFDLILFASVNAVTFFLHRCVGRGIPPQSLANHELAVVGRRTGDELERLKLAPQHIPEEYTSASLVEHFKRIGVSGRRVLMPRGNLAKEDLVRGLVDLGAEVRCVTVYQTVVPDLSDSDGVLRDMERGAIDVITFASPSAANNFAGILQGGDLRSMTPTVRVAVIGPTTADAVRKLGREPDMVAKESSARGLADAIAEFYRQHS